MNPEKRQYYDKYGNLDPQEHAMHDFFILGTAFVAFCISWVLSLFVLPTYKSNRCGQSCGQLMLGVAVVYSDGSLWVPGNATALDVEDMDRVCRRLWKLRVWDLVDAPGYPRRFWVYLRVLSHCVKVKFSED